MQTIHRSKGGQLLVAVVYETFKNLFNVNKNTKQEKTDTGGARRIILGILAHAELAQGLSCLLLPCLVLFFV